MKYDIDSVNKNISFVIGIFLGINFVKKVILYHQDGFYKAIYDNIPKSIIEYLEMRPFIIYFFIIPIVILIIYRLILFFLRFLNEITMYPVLDNVEEFLREKNNFFRRIVGAVFEFPKAACYVILIAFILNGISIFMVGSTLNGYLEISKPYKLLCEQVVIPITNSKVAKTLPKIINNSFRIVEKEVEPNGKENKDGKDNKENTGNKKNSRNVIVYYNGVTLEEGIKSNSEIDNYARKLCEDEKNELNKGKILYKWVGSNISYDEDKASMVLNNDFNVKSGAIPTFETKSGICFDYSCLYVAMCRANGIKVRMVTGEGFNGVSWVSHAWNQVYISSQDKWINVDTTFYRGGNYFNNKRFELDHRNSKVIGEW